MDIIYKGSKIKVLLGNTIIQDTLVSTPIDSCDSTITGFTSYTTLSSTSGIYHRYYYSRVPSDTIVSDYYAEFPNGYTVIPELQRLCYNYSNGGSSITYVLTFMVPYSEVLNIVNNCEPSIVSGSYHYYKGTIYYKGQKSSKTVVIMIQFYDDEGGPAIIYPVVNTSTKKVTVDYTPLFTDFDLEYNNNILVDNKNSYILEVYVCNEKVNGDYWYGLGGGWTSVTYSSINGKICTYDLSSIWTPNRDVIIKINAMQLSRSFNYSNYVYRYNSVTP